MKVIMYKILKHLVFCWIISTIFLSPHAYAQTESVRAANILFSEGFKLFQSGDLDLALVRFEEGLTLHPKSVPALYYAGAILRERGEYDAAAERFKAAVRYGPSTAEGILANKRLASLEVDREARRKRVFYSSLRKIHGLWCAEKSSPHKSINGDTEYQVAALNFVYSGSETWQLRYIVLRDEYKCDGWMKHTNCSLQAGAYDAKKRFTGIRDLDYLSPLEYDGVRYEYTVSDEQLLINVNSPGLGSDSFHISHDQKKDIVKIYGLDVKYENVARNYYPSDQFRRCELVNYRIP